MGTSKTYRGRPASGAQNTPRGKTKVSKGHNITPYEGTIMSGEDEHGQKAGHGARNKSHSSKSSAKNKGPYGQS